MRKKQSYRQKGTAARKRRVPIVKGMMIMKQKMIALMLAALLLLGLAACGTDGKNSETHGADAQSGQTGASEGSSGMLFARDEMEEAGTYFYVKDFRGEFVQSVRFTDSLKDAPRDAADVSALQDGSVLLWYEEHDSLYDVTIGAEGGVKANPNSKWMFGGLRRAVSIDLNNLDTSGVTSMSEMFAEDLNLTSLDLSLLNTSSVTDMSSMFYFCKSLPGIDVSSFDTSNVVNMTRMFDTAFQKEINVSGLNTENVQGMTAMFQQNNVSSLDLSSFQTGKLEFMADMFAKCDDLVELDLSNFDTSHVVNMMGLFYGCEGLRSVDLSSFDTSRVTNMGDMFAYCNRKRQILLCLRQENRHCGPALRHQHVLRNTHLID